MEPMKLKPFRFVQFPVDDLKELRRWALVFIVGGVAAYSISALITSGDIARYVQTFSCLFSGCGVGIWGMCDTIADHYDRAEAA